MGDVSEAAVRAAVVRLDPDAVVLDVSDGWVVHSLDGPGSREAFARLSELELPVAGSLVGEVAWVGARSLVDTDRIDLLVPSMVAVHVRERIGRRRGAPAMTGLLRTVRFLEQRELQSELRRRDRRRRRERRSRSPTTWPRSTASATSRCSRRSYLGSGSSGRNTQVLRANYNTPETIPLY